MGAGAVLRALLHRVLDDYVSVVDGLGGDLADLEDLVLEGDGRMTERLCSSEGGGQVPEGERTPRGVLEGLGDPGLQDGESGRSLNS